MKGTRKLVAALLALVLGVGLLAACGSSTDDSGGTAPATSDTQQASSQPSAQPSVQPSVQTTYEPEAPSEGANLADHIDIIVDSTIAIVNPFMLAGIGMPVQKASDMLHDRLLAQPEPGVVGPQLAYDWETDDYQTFIFYLRDDVYFHNGDHFTADDIIWNVDMAKQCPGSLAYTRWSTVETARAVDTHVVELVLYEVNSDFLIDVSDYYTAICSQGAYNATPDDPTWGLVGTGPFMATAFSSNDYLTVERFDDYWGELPPTRSVTHWSIPELSTRMAMMLTGEAQVCFSMSPEDRNALDANPDFNVSKVLLNEPTWLAFNNQGDAIVTDTNFRLAVAHALNVSDVATVAMGVWAQPAWDGNFWGPITQHRLEGLPQRLHDPALAKEYLDKSVYNGESIEILTAIATNIAAAEMVQQQLMEVGITTHIEIVDISAYLDAVAYNPNATYQMHIMSGGMTPVALQTLRLSYYPGMVANRLNLNNDYITGLIDKLAITFDESEREAICHNIQQFFWDDVSAVPMFWRFSGCPSVVGIDGMKLTSDPFNHSLRGMYWDLNETPANLRP